MQTPLLDRYVWTTLASLLVAVAYVDVRQRRIPNALVAVLFGGGVAYALVAGGVRAAAAALAGGAVGLALQSFQYSRGWIGAGDVKLLAALGAWTGPFGALLILVVASIAGGLLSLFLLARLGRGERADVGGKVLRFAVSGHLVVPEPSRIERARGVPFGVALALGGALVTFMRLGR